MLNKDPLTLKRTSVSNYYNCFGNCPMIIFTNQITFQWQLMVMSMKIAVKKSYENTENRKNGGKNSRLGLVVSVHEI